METNESASTPQISTGDWMITLLIAAIPLVNMLMLFVWAFGSSYHPSKKTWARATLLWILISVITGAVVLLIFGATIYNYLGSGPDFYEQPPF